MGKQWKQWQTLFSWAPKITVDGDCNHEIKRRLLFRWKAMTNLDSILKSRDLADKVLYSQSYGFSSSHVCMWELNHKESWVPKNWCFWTVVLEKTLESPLDFEEIKTVNPKGNQHWIFIGRIDALKLKLQYFGPLMWRADALEKIMMLGKTEGRRRRGQRMRCLDGITNSIGMSFSELREMVKDREAFRAAVHGVTKSWTPLSIWTSMYKINVVLAKGI